LARASPNGNIWQSNEGKIQGFHAMKTQGISSVFHELHPMDDEMGSFGNAQKSSEGKFFSGSFSIGFVSFLPSNEAVSIEKTLPKGKTTRFSS
jgi:hypothetical protein